MVDLSHKTTEGLGPVSNREPAQPRGTAASRPRPAAPCFPACRSSISSRCSSCRCCTRNSSSLCYTTATVAPRTVVGTQGHQRGIQTPQDKWTVVLGLSPTTNNTTRLWREALLFPSRLTTSPLRLQHSLTLQSPSRVHLLQSLCHQSCRRTAVLPKPPRSVRRIHPRQKRIKPYLCRYSFIFDMYYCDDHLQPELITSPNFF